MEISSAIHPKDLSIQISSSQSWSGSKIQRHLIDLVQTMTICIISITYSIYRMRISNIDKYINMVYKLIRNQYVIIMS
jgi:hypothetical protein